MSTSGNTDSNEPNILNEAPLRNYEIAELSSREHHHDFDLHAGAEPGVNPLSGRSKAEYSHFKQDCVIEVVDYEQDDIKFRNFNNQRFIDLMNESDPREHPDDAQNSLPKHRGMVRWINIGGIDWSVLSVVAVKYKLHSLALEDILHEQGHNHSKADYYPGHLFIRILSHTVALTESGDNVDDIDFSTSYPTPHKYVPGNLPTSMDLEEGGYATLQKTLNGDKKINNNENSALRLPRAFHSPLKKRMSGLSGFGGLARESRNRAIQILKKDDCVTVKHEPMFIFLLPDGTVISIRSSPTLEFTLPIKERLHLPDSILRVSEDASLLVEALLDLVADRIMEVVDEYQVKLSKLEHAMLLRPVMQCVRSLHILSGDLILAKRTLDPVKIMISGLRTNDLQRCQALAASLAKERRNLDARDPTAQSNAGEDENKDADAKKKQRSQYQPSAVQAGGGDSVPVSGYFSFKAKVYLADVTDHMDFALSSLDMFSAMSENLLNYAFNTASYDMNVVMNRLTMTSIVFLPLTVLTGYFGMNFTAFWSVQSHSDLFFWELAIPIMIVLIPMLMWREIENFVRYLMRREDSRRAANQVREGRKND